MPNQKYLILLLFFIFSETHGQVAFKRTYGFGSVNEGRCVVQTFDNGYALAGSTTPGWGGQTNFYLLKTDSMGIFQYHFSYGGAGIEQASSIVQMPDSGFLLAGFSNGYSANNDYDAMLLRTDKNGNQLWVKTFGTPDWDFIYDMKATPDGNFILAGNTYGSGNGTSSGYLVKVDPAGNVIWQKFIEQNQIVNLKKIAVKNDGTFVACGSVSTTNSYPVDGFIAYLDANGDTLKTKTIDFGKHESINAIDYFSNGDLAVTGSSIDSSAQDDIDELIMRMDNNASILWSLIPHQVGDGINNDIIVVNDTILTAGSLETNGTSGAGKNDFHIVRFDQNGVFLDGHTYGATEDEFCYDIIHTNDEGFLLAGTTTTYGPGQQSIMLVKTDNGFTLDPNILIDVRNITDENNCFTIFPNPSNGILNIDSKQNTKQFHLRLTNYIGESVFETSCQSFPVKINLPEVKQGFYFLEIGNSQYTEKKKILILK